MLTLNVKDKEYTLRLTSRELRNLEKRENKSIIRIFTEMEDVSVINPFIKVIHAALQCHHPGTSLDDVYDLYDDLVEFEGYDLLKLQALTEEILATAGLKMRTEESKE